MLLGTVSRIISEKGIGFITPCGPGRDVFFHASAVADEQFEQLQEGQSVSFDLELTSDMGDRQRAAKVKPCDKKLLGRTGAAEIPPARHPRARNRKPTWRK